MKRMMYYLFQNGEFETNVLELFKLTLSTFVGFILGLLILDIKVFIVASIIFLCVVIAYTFVISSKEHNFDVLKTLKQEEKNGNWIEVIRFGYPLSRPLWLSGRYELRIEIGQIVRNAALKIDGKVNTGRCAIDSKEILAGTLIDDLGWTRYKCGQVQKAISNIEEGVYIAKENGYYEIAIKGNRHLLGIYSKEKDVNKFEKCDGDIKELLDKIEGTDNIKSINAGLEYARAKLHRNVKEFDQALNKAQKARDLYLKINDPERYVKTFDLIASIYDKMDEYKKAELTLEEGLEKAKRMQRKERYLRMAIFYFKIIEKNVNSDDEYSKQEYFDLKDRMLKVYNDAKNVANESQNKTFVDELKTSYKSLLKRINEKLRMK